MVWTPDLAFQVKRVSQVAVSPDGKRVAYVVASAQMEGEKSEWLSQICVARRGRLGGRPAHPRREVVERARLVARRPVDRVRLRRAAGKPQTVAHARGGGEAEMLTDEKSAPAVASLVPRRHAASRS